jgi:hypothetical protein
MGAAAERRLQRDGGAAVADVASCKKTVAMT